MSSWQTLMVSVAAVSPHRWATASRLAVPLFGLVFAAATIGVFAILPTEPTTTYAVIAPWAMAADLIAGLGLLAAGCIAWLDGRWGSIGLVTAFAGVAWFASDWVGWDTGPPVPRSAARVAALFVLPLVVHLASAFPVGRVSGRGGRAFVITAYFAATIVSLGLALARDPFLDLHCWQDCSADNVFLVHGNLEVMHFIVAFSGSSSLVIGLLLVFGCYRRLARTSHGGRAATWFVLVPAALVGLAETVRAVLTLIDPVEAPRRPAFASMFLARSLALGALAVGVIWGVYRNARTRRAVARLADELGDAPLPGTLQTALAESLGDHDLEIAFWLPDSRRYVDAAGKPSHLRPDDERATTSVVRGGEQIAIVVHDQTLSRDQDLAGEIGAVVRLAIDNERLRAELLAQLDDLRASRSRIVEAGDAARRRLERDLHDGAQQRLLAVAHEMRLARSAADDDGASSADLDATIAEVLAALTELRELAHGIFPAILDEAGLGPALSTLADGSSIPVVLDELPDERLPAEVERAAYVFVSEAIEANQDIDALHASVRREGADLVVELEGVHAGPYVHLADRVGSVGGHVDARRGHLRAEIPCA